MSKFSPEDARAYVDQERPDVPVFTESEKARILEFADGHPLGLQCACYHVLAGRQSRDELANALRVAREECDEFEGLN